MSRNDDFVEVVPRTRDRDAHLAFARWLRENSLLESALDPAEIMQELFTDAHGKSWTIYRVRRTAFDRLRIPYPDTSGTDEDA